jgi:DNA (cytosine-5)-methyltransferase 1
MTRRLLDLFSGAGGAAMGYARAGFQVTGVDIEPHPDYPFPLVVRDALDYLDNPFVLNRFDVVHASPPCPHYSVATNCRDNRDDHRDLVDVVRQGLRAWGGVYVIENVPRAPLDHPVLLCGWGMGLRHIRRHRCFESNAPLMSPGCLCPQGDTVSVFGHSGEDRRRTTYAELGKARFHLPIEEVRQLLGVEWMTRRDDVSDAVPPAYTECLGEQLLDHLTREEAS